MRIVKLFKPLLLTTVCSSALMIGAPVQAQPLSELLPDLLKNHHRIKASKADLDAAKEGIDKAFGDYLPSVTASGTWGHEAQTKPADTDTDFMYKDASISASQLIYDFGKTPAKIKKARLTAERSRITFEEAKNGLVFEAISAYMGLLKAVRTRGYALQTEANIKKYTGLEESRVERGRGLRSDVLQAKRNLADATASRIGADGALQTAVNRFKSVFRIDAIDLKTFQRPEVPYSLLPETVDEAVRIAMDNNAGLKIAQIAYDISKQTIRADKASLYAPEITAGADFNYKKNASGTYGHKTERLVKLEMSVPLYSGGKDLATYNASLRTSDASANRQEDKRYTVEETVRNAWQKLQTARATSGYRRNSANISAEFLTIANRERELNKRSLLDIMYAENAYYNALSAAESGDMDMALAVYELLFAMGQLNMDTVKEAASAEGLEPEITPENG